MSNISADQQKLDPDEALRSNMTRHLFRRISAHNSILIGGTVLGAIVFMALFAPLLAPHDPFSQDLSKRLLPPFWMEEHNPKHILGTDNLGRDYLSRLIYGAQISLMIGVCTAIISGIIGSALGITAGYFGGRVDAVITFIITTRLSMPIVLVALAVVALVGGSLHAVILVLGFLLWDRYAVVMRSATQQARNMDYVSAARAIGCPTWRGGLSEIFPNVVNNLIVIATFEVAHAILLEASLSFLGLGVQPPDPSWGLMIAEGKEFLLFDPWVITIPGIALSVLVLAVNMLGDGIRDVSAPENRN